MSNPNSGAVRRIWLPPQFALQSRVKGNSITQLHRPAQVLEGTLNHFQQGRLQAQRFQSQTDDILILSLRAKVPAPFDQVLLVRDGDSPSDQQWSCQWISPLPRKTLQDLAQDAARCKSACDSWQGRVRLNKELKHEDQWIQKGLRGPQFGALHKAIGHWEMSDEPATIVMPTGTGKTETMLAITTHERLEKLLVIVPNSPLREQIAGKFVSLGVLKQCEFLAPDALYPVVGTMEKSLHTASDVDEFFGRCNVIVATIQIINACSESAKRYIARVCSHLFIDEAHHVQAATWESFRRLFEDKHVLQFTATPYRGDGKHVDGKVIFNYPLRRAQEEGYFKPLHFRPVIEFNVDKSDETIARAALAQLAADSQAGYVHVVMARTNTIAHAKEITSIYQRLAPELCPQFVYSKMGESEKREKLRLLQSGESRVVICVDMLGEGFDLPELKIAALHKIHKGLAVTIQFIGRFTRVKSNANLGDATVIANLGDPDVDKSVNGLYGENADWNVLLPRLSMGAANSQEQKSEFFSDFVALNGEELIFPLQNVNPKMSTVVYRCECDDWNVSEIEGLIGQRRLHLTPVINTRSKVGFFVVKEQADVDWADMRDLRDSSFVLYLFHFDCNSKLLYIHCSTTGSLHEELAKAIAGDEVELIRGEEIFRALHGINQLILMNLGLKHSLSRAVRFSMFVGPDIKAGLAQANTEGKQKSNLFGRGYESGDKASLGCSTKGRVWAYQTAADMEEWMRWCHQIGKKLTDGSISVDRIFDNLIVPRPVTKRPNSVPIGIEWSEFFLGREEDHVYFDVAGEEVPFYEVGLELCHHDISLPLRFRVFTSNNSVEYEVHWHDNSVEFLPITDQSVSVRLAKRTKSLSEWFQEEPPIFRFENGDYLIYNEFCEIPRDLRHPFDTTKIEAWDWTGVDLKKESQKEFKFSDSIQFHVIRELDKVGHDPEYDVIFDDDTAYEAADVVCLKVAGDRLMVDLFHCKFSSELNAGARVADLYAVCGQAQSSTHWKGDVAALLEHLRLREIKFQRNTNGISRFERGDMTRLREIIREARYLNADFRIFIVQPGLSKSKAARNQSIRDLLATTELALQTTYGIPLTVIGSA